MGDYDTSFPGEDETLGWFDWLLKPKARKPITLRDRLVQTRQEINALIGKRNTVIARIRTNAQQINRLRAQAGSLTPTDESKYAMEDDTLGLITGLFSWAFRPKSVTAQIAELNKKRRALFAEANTLGRQIRVKKAAYTRLRGLWTRATVSARARAAMVPTTARAAWEAMMTRGRTTRAPSITAAMTGLTATERNELSRRMRMGWAQRPGAPDMPGEAAAKIAGMAAYNYNLASKIRNRLIRERKMGRAQRPGAPDMPGEAAAKMRRAGVMLGPESLRIDEELIL